MVVKNSPENGWFKRVSEFSAKTFHLSLFAFTFKLLLDIFHILKLYQCESYTSKFPLWYFSHKIIACDVVLFTSKLGHSPLFSDSAESLFFLNCCFLQTWKLSNMIKTPFKLPKLSTIAKLILWTIFFMPNQGWLSQQMSSYWLVNMATWPFSSFPAIKSILTLFLWIWISNL